MLDGADPAGPAALKDETSPGRGVARPVVR
jgi:hypothetical protein